MRVDGAAPRRAAVARAAASCEVHFDEGGAPAGARLPSTRGGDMGSLVLGAEGALYYSMALAADQSRTRLSVLRSDDGAATWPRGALVYAGPAAYSDLVPLADPSRLGLAYERDVDDQSCRGESCRIVFTTVATALPPFVPP